MNKEEFYEALKKLNIVLTNEAKKQLEIYKEFLVEYNSHTNLTAIEDEKGIYLKHFYDSLTINNYIKENYRVLDIGTGAGFPGMVLAIVNNKTHFVLLDSNHKKTDFLKLLKEKLNLENVEIINERAEEYVKKNLERFDIVTSRAVSQLHILAELSLPALKIGGFFIPLKASVEKEYPLFLEAIEELKGKIIEKKEFVLPFENSKRTIIVVEHENKTSTIYPRSYDKILKKPLKNKKN